jgi:hypothetical protein
MPGLEAGHDEVERGRSRGAGHGEAGSGARRAGDQAGIGMSATFLGWS